jgi:hypothetical protein
LRSIQLFTNKAKEHKEKLVAKTKQKQTKKKKAKKEREI